MECLNVEQQLSERLEAELERAKRQNDHRTIRVLLRIKHGTVYGPKETWRPKLKEDWGD